MGAFPFPTSLIEKFIGTGPDTLIQVIDWQPVDNKTLGYYPFWFGGQQPDPDPADAPKPKPANCIEVLKQHEEVIEKALDAMPQIQKLIIYRTLNAQGVRMDHIDREIYREAQKELAEARKSQP